MAISGKDGTITSGGNEIIPISNIKLTETANNPARATNQTGGAKGRVHGVDDASGSFEFAIDDGKTVPWKKGDTATIVIDMDGNAVNTKTLPIIIDSTDLDLDVNDGGDVVIPIAFSATGAVVDAGLFAASGV